MNKDFLETWLVANYPFVMLAMVDEKDRPNLQKVINACKKYDVPFKTFVDILHEANKGD